MPAEEMLIPFCPDVSMMPAGVIMTVEVPHNSMIPVGELMVIPSGESISVGGGDAGVNGAGMVTGGVGPDCMMTAGGTSVNTT